MSTGWGNISFKDCHFKEISQFGKYKYMYPESKEETSYRVLSDQWDNVYHLVASSKGYGLLHPCPQEGCNANALSTLPETIQDYVWSLPPPYKAYQEVQSFESHSL